jgi:hypothetical protein
LPQRREAFRSVRLQAVTWKILNYGESIPYGVSSDLRG